MKVLHTSDWHLGRSLYGRKRYAEFESFLSWLAETITTEVIDVLLVAGDVFDTSTPSNRAQELYYDFLGRIARSTCHHVVIIGGNHDSPSFLNAPRDLLRSLNVHVIGATTGDPADEVLVLKDESGREEAIVCAVPYLRDRDIRTSEAGETTEEKDLKLIEGISAHYREVCDSAELIRQQLAHPVPLIAVGHLFTAGGTTVEGDGVRELFIGSLARVSTEIFPDSVDYCALGHLHIPQMVNESAVIRYSGSPLPMGFNEAGREKSVCLVTFPEGVPSVERIPVPVFQSLERIRGAWSDISARLAELVGSGSSAWLEIIYEGDDIAADLRDRLDQELSGTSMEILRVRNNRIIERALNRQAIEETLDDLTVNDVFGRCLEVHGIPAEQRPELLQTFQEAVLSLESDDARAE